MSIETTVVDVKKLPLSFGWGCNFSLVYTKDKVFEHHSTSNFSSCRTQMSDGMFRHYAEKEFPDLNFRKGFVDKKIIEGDTGVLIACDEAPEERINKNLKKLHELEKQAEINQLTRIYKTKNDFCYLAIGHPAWKSCLWKYNLWTFYIKHVFNDNPFNLKNESHYKSLEDGDNHNIYLSKVLKENKEIYSEDVYGKIPNYDTVHFRTGFVAIASGGNNPMAKLLGIKVTKRNYNF